MQRSTLILQKVPSLRKTTCKLVQSFGSFVQGQVESNERSVSKETVSLHQRESETLKFGIKEIDQDQIFYHEDITKLTFYKPQPFIRANRKIVSFVCLYSGWRRLAVGGKVVFETYIE